MGTPGFNQLMDSFSAYPGELLWNIEAPTVNPPTIANKRLTLSASALTDLRYNRNPRNAQLVTASVVATESLHILATLRADELADGVLTGVVLKDERDHAAWFGVLRHAAISGSPRSSIATRALRGADTPLANPYDIPRSPAVSLLRRRVAIGPPVIAGQPDHKCEVMTDVVSHHTTEGRTDPHVTLQ